MAKLEFWFDIVSPYTYLASRRLQTEEPFTSMDIEWVPVFLGGLFQQAGNVAPATVPSKGAYMLQDLKRLARRYGIDYRFPAVFPANTLQVMRAATALKQEGAPDFLPYCNAMFKAYWSEDRNIADPAVWSEIVRDLGLDPEALLAEATAPAIKDALKQNTGEAVERGVFGLPTFFVGSEMYFGCDRLFLVAEALKAAG